MTTVDPDDIITKNKLGAMVETVDEMVSEIRKLEADNTLWKQVSSQCRQYFEDRHKPETATIGFEKLFAEL